MCIYMCVCVCVCMNIYMYVYVFLCTNHSVMREGRLRLTKQAMGGELMAPKIDHTTRIPSGVASPVTAKHAAKV